MWLCCLCMWERAPNINELASKDTLMSPWPVWLFTGCPLPICQSELASTLTAHGDERPLSLRFPERQAVETRHVMVHAHMLGDRENKLKFDWKLKSPCKLERLFQGELTFYLSQLSSVQIGSISAMLDSLICWVNIRQIPAKSHNT